MGSCQYSPTLCPYTQAVPELPDITVYLHALERRVLNRSLRSLRLLNPFVLRTVTPAPEMLADRTVTGLSRIGKRLVIAYEGDLWSVIHLMVAGRLRWLEVGKKPPGKLGLAALEFEHGTLLLTEAGSKRRATLQLFDRRETLLAIDPGGAEVQELSLAQFSHRLTATNHTLKRALTDPHIFSGIGNAYSDEILHRARLSPLALTQKLKLPAIEQLYHAVGAVLEEWTERLQEQAGDRFPEKVTAFRPEMAVHGRYGKPCPVCAAPIQRIVHATNEVNYCARCQTGGKLLADRAMSRLLHSDWPKNIDELS